MKTLDEVIKNLGDGTEHLSAILISKETWSDTLHYLQEYKAKMKVLEYKSKRYDEMCETIQKQGQEHEDRCQAEIARYQEAVRNCEEAENKYRQLVQNLGEVGNDPLSWEELKAMEGKPVWVEQTMVLEEGTPEEYTQDVKEWMIVSNIGHRCIDMVNVNDGELRFDRSDLTWQAYRKERG